MSCPFKGHKGSESQTSNRLIPSLTLHQLSHLDPQEKGWVLILKVLTTLYSVHCDQ